MKIRNSLAILCSAAFCFALSLAGCNNKSSGQQSTTPSDSSSTPSDSSGSEEQTFTVTFDSQGGSPVTAQQIKKGEKVTKPTNPTREGYTFGAWYREAACENEYNFALAVRSSFTLYAGWTQNGGGEVDPPTPPQPATYDYYATIGGTEYGLAQSDNPLQTGQTGEWTASIGTVTAGQAVVIMDSNKVALSQNFGAEPGDNNVVENAGAYTIHNDAENVVLIVKTWDTPWTNFYISGYDSGSVTPPDPSQAAYYATIGINEFALTPSGNDLATDQTGEWKADLGNVTAGQAVVIMDANKTALSTDFGAEPGNNNVSGTVGSFTIHNDAENAFILVKTWQSGWTNFYISGYVADETPTTNGHGPEGSHTVSWYILGKGSFTDYDWDLDHSIQLYSNPLSETDLGCILDVHFESGDVFKVSNGTIWYGYEKVDRYNDGSGNNKGITNFEAVDDGYDNDSDNIKCTVTGNYDIYVNQSGQFWIQAAA